MKLPMFARLPTKMEKLETVLTQTNAALLRTPPPFLETGKKLRQAYRLGRSEQYSSLSQQEWRLLPYALWIEKLPALHETDPELIQRYWNEVLPTALQSRPRRAKRWLTPLFFVYCHAFDPDDALFQDFSIKLNQVLSLAQVAEAIKLKEMGRQLEFFTPTRVAARLAKMFFTLHDKTLDELMSDLMLWPEFNSTRLGLAVLQAGLQFPPQKLREPQTVNRIMQWEQKMQVRIVKTHLRIAFADSLLLPWGKERKVTAELKEPLLEFFLQQYHDPRLIRHANYQWEGVQPDSIEVMQYLLAGDTLKTFMRILEHTADEIWRYRQKFWMAYYDAGHIEEAWLVLGSNAQTAAQNTIDKKTSLHFGRLEGGAQPNQSVLLLRIGDLIFSEWSHNGSLRAYKKNNPDAPSLYQLSYHGDDLRDTVSLDFHEGLNKRPQLTHSHSDSGTWQRKARDMIHDQTNIYLHDWEILL